MADWQKIRREYITTNTSYRKLAAKYGIQTAVLGQRAKRENWVEQKAQYLDKTQTKTLEAISNRQADRAAKLSSVADLLLDKIKSLVEDSPTILMNPQNLKHISGVLKDIKEIQMIRSDADLREQEARIEKLRKDTADPQNLPTIIVQGLPEEYRS